MAHVVIIGASTGGLPTAYEIREMLDSEHKVTVISNTDTFHFVPSNPWVAVGWRTREDTSFKLAPYITAKGIDFIPVAVSKIAPDENRLVLADDRVIEYDYLVIATGPKLAFDEIEGTGPDGFTASICTLDHAEKAYRKWQSFVENPGPIVVGAVQGASCFGPAYEFAFIMDADLRKRRIRDRVPMTFVTSEPYIGHLGLAGVGDSRGMLESELRQRHIPWICNAAVTKVEQDTMFVTEHDNEGKPVREHELPFRFSMMLPAFKGVDPVMEVGEDLVNPRGFVKVDNYQRNPKWNNIYSVGVCIAIPPVEATPVPTGAPKTGYMIESMATAVAHNIRDALAGKEPSKEATWNAICLADMGDTGAAFVAIPQIPPRNVAWMKKGKWVHLAKKAFEKYFISKMKNGTSEPIFEKYILKMLGIDKLK
ncbi:MAG TPA: NAD(P)/FAD-dependent oxidoreductase [Gammaproteobacteria bacterium]|nr:NAD(P)/FAD-dependent oxidoreductase [Gammaproteobacteria bacterium]